MDNCSAHILLMQLASIVTLRNTTVFYLPPNTTSKIQPCDSRIIRSLKAYYRRRFNDLLIQRLHYNNRGLFCDPNIIANNKERNFRKPVVTNHNSSQTLNLLRYHNIRTRTIASPSQLPNLIKSQNFSDYNYFYTLFAINTTSETICNKPITATN